MTLPPVFTAGMAHQAGLTRSALRHRLHTGSVVRVRQGVFCSAPLWQSAAKSPSARHLIELHAVALLLRRPLWVAGYSAAALHRLPVPSGEPALARFVSPRAHGTATSGAGFAVSTADVPAAHRVEDFGLRLLSVPRTCGDIARQHGIAPGLVVADAALRTERMTPDEFASIAVDTDGWPQVGRLRTVAQHASGARESPAESTCFALFLEAGVPLPDCNPWLELGDGTRVRPDFRWRRHRLVGEVDGQVKYLDPYEKATETLWQEKLRQSALEAMGFVVVRWTGWEVQNAPLVVIERLVQSSRRAHAMYGAPLLMPGAA